MSGAAGPVTLDMLASHLRLDPGAVAEEAELLGLYLGSATEFVETHTELKLRGDDGEAVAVPDMARAAILLLAGHFYANREAVSATKLEEVPLGVRRLLWLLQEPSE